MRNKILISILESNFIIIYKTLFRGINIKMSSEYKKVIKSTNYSSNRQGNQYDQGDFNSSYGR